MESFMMDSFTFFLEHDDAMVVSQSFDSSRADGGEKKISGIFIDKKNRKPAARPPS
jgi:hypothetical protein